MLCSHCNIRNDVFEKLIKDEIDINTAAEEWTNNAAFNPSLMYDYFSQLIAEGKEQSKIDYFINYSSKNLNKLNKEQKIYLNIIKSAQDLFRQNIDAAIKQLENVDFTINQRNRKMYLWSLVLKANAQFLNGQTKEASKVYLIAFELAVEFDEQPFVELLCVNLGAIEYENGRFAKSTYFLRKAYRLMQLNGQMNPILLNNLASSLLDEYHTVQAIKILKEAGADGIKNPKNYQEHLLLINYTNAWQQYGDYLNAEKILNYLRNSDVPEVLRPPLLAISLKQMEQDNWEGISDFVIANSKQLADNFNWIFARIPKTMYQLALVRPLIFRSFCPNFDSNKVNILNVVTQPKVKYYLLASLQSAGFAMNDSIQGLKQLALLEALNTDSYSSSGVKEIIEIEQELLQKTKKLKLEEFKRKQNSLIGLAIGVGFIMLILILLYKRRLTQEKLKVAKLNLESAELDKQNLAEKERLNARITALSAIILDKTRDIVQFIDSAPNSKDKTLAKVKKELMSIYISDKVIDTRISNQLKLENYNEIWNRYPDLNALSKTSKNVLILSTEGLGPKEISTILNLNYSYIRNLKSNILNVLKKNGLHSFDDVTALVKTVE